MFHERYLGNDELIVRRGLLIHMLTKRRLFRDGICSTVMSHGDRVDMWSELELLAVP